MTLFLIAHVAGHCVAFDTATIESVVDLGAIVPTPQVDADVIGLTALRSRVVTVIDTGATLGLATDRHAARRAVVAKVEGHYYAFVVDTLEDVVEHERLPLTGGVVLQGGWARAATGYIRRGDEAALTLDVAALIPVSAAATVRVAA